MDVLKTIYSFDTTISIIMLLGIVIGLIGVIIDKNKRVFLCLLMVEGMYGLLIYLGTKFEHTGIAIFFGLIILLVLGVFVIQQIKDRNKKASAEDAVDKNE